MFTTRSFVSIFSIAMMALGAEEVSGQNYPNKPIRIITIPIGGGADVVARLLAQEISGPLGQQMIIDNRPAAFTGETMARVEQALEIISEQNYLRPWPALKLNNRTPRSFIGTGPGWFPGYAATDTGVRAGSWYSCFTFSCKSFARVASGKWPKSLAITSRDLGQVEFSCGKSFDHMQLSAPHPENSNWIGGSSKKVA